MYATSLLDNAYQKKVLFQLVVRYYFLNFIIVLDREEKVNKY
jgi:hypothetical protein